ncbi:phage head morphogenesis protein, SPP1 gp7 family [Candidatus Ornithobacterium hominis]|uniref:phage head morphogenesis protein n=1 Tax=Candidatus Ornithobacterium hominis TaxID=2497989 RepID=UPI000E9A1BD9|nr:phage minor head protein [Candidatus Ornithobacterium hominis]SZD73691.1 phage head morphogenesis protein, SPP1 gp7 family [Candidatus Ornithobacterium hominis]
MLRPANSYQYFTAAVDVGYNSTFEFYSKELAANLYANIAQFSAFKARSFEKSLTEALWHKGDFISWNEFKKVGASINQDYNKNWLKTEYHQTVATANMAGKWQDIQRTKDLYPNLKYVTVGDERVRAQHREWDGIVLSIEHPWWKTHYPPNDWGCRCDVERTDDPVSSHIPNGQLKVEFENNAAQSGKVFSSSIYLTSGGFNPETIEKIIDWGNEMYKKTIIEAKVLKEKAKLIAPYKTNYIFCKFT